MPGPPERSRAAHRAAFPQPSGGFILLRLVLFCLVVGAALYRGRPSEVAQILLWAYFAATLAFLLFYRGWRNPRWRRLARRAGSVQILLEVAVAGAVLAHSNAFTSPFVLLFILTFLVFRLIHPSHAQSGFPLQE